MGICFVDTETTGLDPWQHQIWEVGLITPDDEEHTWQLAVDLGRADKVALDIGRFYERRDEAITWSKHFAREFEELTRGHHLAGAVVSFDAERLWQLLRENGACPAWHYHLVDVEALAAGRLGSEPPWSSEELSRMLDVEPDTFERHTALGDARWAKAIYDAVIYRGY